MTTLLALGGEWGDPDNWVPAQVPTVEDNVITNPSTQDIYVDITSTCRSLNLTDFTGEIYYALRGGTSIRMAGVIKNENKYDVFQARPDIIRVD